MKVARIELKDFRGFPAPEIYTFNLAEGKNLLLYGENGSGKSSLYRAITEFFNLRHNAQPFRSYRNIFSSPPGCSNVDGYVALQFDDGARREWKFLGQRPISDTTVAQHVREALIDASRRAALLEYRSLLQTNFPSTNVRKRLFDLAVETLLGNIPVNLPGQTEKTVSQLWQRLLGSRPKRNTSGNVRFVSNALNSFKDGFNGILPDVENKAGAFLTYFTGAGLRLKIDAVSVRYEDSKHDVVERVLNFQVTLRDVVVPEWNEFLNEARLSALALSLYLAGAALSNPTPPVSVGIPLKLLVLDDVLIGLDLANRLPVLRLVEKEFVDKGWQVFLLTFDRAWYEVARQELRSASWCQYELFTIQVGNHEQPLLLPDEQHLYRALAFLDAGEVKAASIHVRTAFENLLKSACQELGVKVRFHCDPRKVNAVDLWSALKSKKYEFMPAQRCAFDSIGRVRWWQPQTQEIPVVPLELQKRIDHAVRWVLNPLSHSQSVERYRAEIEDAIYAIDDLEVAVKRATTLPSVRPSVGIEMLISLLKAHIARMENGMMNAGSSGHD